MLMEENFSEVKLMGDGLRYRKKRKFKDAGQPAEGIENKKAKENVDSKGKIFKFSVNKESNIGSVLNENKLISNNNIKKIKESDSKELNKEQIPVSDINKLESKLKTASLITHGGILPKIQPTTLAKFDYIQKEIMNEGSAKNLNMNTNQNKKKYLKEFERMKNIVKKYEEYFTNDYMLLLIDKVLLLCGKNDKKLKNFKVTSLFKNEKFNIDLSNYSKKTSIINLELFAIDILINSRPQYQSLLEVDCPNLGNILLCYYSQIYIVKVLNSILLQMEANILKNSEVVTIKFKNTDNLTNQNKLKAIQQIFDVYKQSYLKCAKIDKSLKRGRQISSEYENMVYSEIFNIFSKSFEPCSIVHFQFVHPIQTIFTNNESYVDFQIKKSNVYNANRETIDTIKKRINILKVKSELRNNSQDLFHTIANLDLYYIDTSELIKDYLEN